MSGTRTILVVDDEESVREILVDYLSDEGYLVFEAGDGPEAVSIVDKQQPHLVLLDLKLVSQSGLEVLKAIRQIRPETVVVMLTGSLAEQDAREAIKLGAYDYITKPISLDDVKNLILDRVWPPHSY